MNTTTGPAEAKPRDDNFKNAVETWGKWIGILVSIVAFLFGVYTFYKNYPIQSGNYSLQIKNYTRELKKPFYEKQLETYRNAIQTVQALATIDDRTSNVWKDTTKKFWGFYWGEMGLFETEGVERAMIEIGRCLKAKSACVPDLEHLSLDLSYKMRDSIQSSWNVDLPALSRESK